MATIVENAAKGQRVAMTTLCEANQKRVYYVARCLLMNAEQAADATVAVFREAWTELKRADIATEERFSNYLIGKVVEYCKQTAYQMNPKALSVPQNKSFTLPANLMVSDCYESEIHYLLVNLPLLQKYIFVMHTAGAMEILQIARILKLDSRTVRAAVQAEADNFKRLQGMSERDFSGTYDSILQTMQQAHREVSVPDTIVEQVVDEIDAVATPAEARERKKYTACVVSVLVTACALIVAMILGFRSGGFLFSADESTASTTQEGTAATVVPTKSDAEQTSDATEANETPADGLEEDLTYYADIEIRDYGTITVKLDQAAAPITCANFVKLAESGFYDGLTFHRIQEGFVMQGGDPEGTGYGGSEETIPGEFSANGYTNTLSHTRGAVSMARSSGYDSASSQFFIVHQDASDSLDGLYAAFGYVTEGMDVVDAVCQAAEPTDDTGTIPAENQPVITAVTIRTEPVS